MSTALSGKQRLAVLACIVGIPYIRAKLKDLYERLGGGVDPEIANARRENDPRGDLISRSSTLKRWILRLFKAVYPYLNLLYAMLDVGFDINYAFGNGEWRWWMPICGVSVVRDDGSASMLVSNDSSDAKGISLG